MNIKHKRIASAAQHRFVRDGRTYNGATLTAIVCGHTAQRGARPHLLTLDTALGVRQRAIEGIERVEAVRGNTRFGTVCPNCNMRVPNIEGHACPSKVRGVK